MVLMNKQEAEIHEKTTAKIKQPGNKTGTIPGARILAKLFEGENKNKKFMRI